MPPDTRDGASIASELRAAVDEGVQLILSVPEARTTVAPTSGGWCAREIIGHLIDSACNNHRRFIINQDAPLMVIDPYDQNAWVARHRYADRPAAELTALWAVYNRHIATVIEVMPRDVLHKERGPIAHLGFSYITTGDTMATIGHLAEDYVGHLRHHLAQLRTLLG